jgi:hypothetical protein
MSFQAQDDCCEPDKENVPPEDEAEEPGDAEQQPLLEVLDPAGDKERADAEELRNSQREAKLSASIFIQRSSSSRRSGGGDSFGQATSASKRRRGSVRTVIIDPVTMISSEIMRRNLNSHDGLIRSQMPTVGGAAEKEEGRKRAMADYSVPISAGGKRRWLLHGWHTTQVRRSRSACYMQTSCLICARDGCNLRTADRERRIPAAATGSDAHVAGG